jgi:hypothetical protein
MALFRDLQAAIRSELGGDVDDDLLLHEIARRALGGTDDGGRAPYQVAVTRCDACELVAIAAGGESHPVDAVVEDMIACDAQHIPHAGADNKRAMQSVPPARRRAVIRRDNACAVPGCRNHRHLHVHHVKPRSEGGNHDPLLLVPLCHRHHTACHAGTLVISGNAQSGFTFRHADGAEYGQPLNPAAVELATQTFDALRALGFKMIQARKLIDTVQHAGAPDTFEAFLHAALRATWSAANPLQLPSILFLERARSGSAFLRGARAPWRR